MVDGPREHDLEPVSSPAGEAEGATGREARRHLVHDARNALNQIIGYGEMLGEQAAAEGQPAYREDLAKIVAVGRRLQGIVERLGTPTESAAPGPTSEATPAQERPAASSPLFVADEESCFDPRSASILVVDDNELNRDLLARRLQLKGYQVEIAEGGNQALQRVAGHAYDLILLDVNMPGVDGLQVLATLRQHHAMSALPIIMATARDTSGDVVAALQAGANDYVTKPLDMPVVLARVHCQLTLKWARDEVGRLNHNLHAAQARIAELVESSAEAMTDLERWASTVSRDLARMLGIDEIAVWVRERETLLPLTETASAAPALSLLDRLDRGAHAVDWEGHSAVAVTGFSGERLGLVIARGTRLLRDETSAHLVASFARQLGSALEMRRARQELAEIERRRSLQREQMLERGVDLLQICPECGTCYDQRSAHCDDDGAALEASEPFPYRIAGRYRLGKVLGQGGMGVVFVAHDERLGRPVAVKVVSTDQFADASLRQRFENEARTVAGIDHPGVVAVFDSGEAEDGSLFIVMELLQGHELGAVVDACGPGTPQQVAALLRQVGSALSAAHASGIVHRDIKPANIVLTATATGVRAKILDFGVAKQIAMETSLTQTGTIVGTPRYMSPEQITGKPVDGRSDLYSFAAVVYLALTGHDVTPNRGFAEVLVDVLQTRPPPLSTHCPGVPEALDAAFARALAKDPRERPGSVSAWADEVAVLLDPLPAWSDGWRIAEGPLPSTGQGADAAEPRTLTTRVMKNL